MPRNRAADVALALGGLAALGRAAIRWPRMARWGATVSEVLAPMPGDELVEHARYCSTHAVSIAAPAEEVWPWLVQLGQGRGGFYSYDRLENLLGLDIHNLDHVEPALQDLAVGDVVRLVPDGTDPPLRFVVARLEAPTLLVLGPDRSRAEAFAAHVPHPAWTFQVSDEEDGGSRLVARFQMDFAPSALARAAYSCVLPPVHLLMERRMLIGIQQRAECARGPGPHLSVTPA